MWCQRGMGEGPPTQLQQCNLSPSQEGVAVQCRVQRLGPQVRGPEEKPGSCKLWLRLRHEQ